MADHTNTIIYQQSLTMKYDITDGENCGQTPRRNSKNMAGQ